MQPALLSKPTPKSVEIISFLMSRLLQIRNTTVPFNCVDQSQGVSCIHTRQIVTRSSFS
jgi:hypothetical protein